MREGWTHDLSQPVLGSMNEFQLRPWVFETQFDEISRLVQNPDFDNENGNLSRTLLISSFFIFVYLGANSPPEKTDSKSLERVV